MQNPSGTKMVPEFITLASSIIMDYDSHLLIEHDLTPVNQRILKKIKHMLSPRKAGPAFMNIKCSVPTCG